MKASMMDKNILHTSIRIDSSNPVHTRISIFQGEAYSQADNPIPLWDLARGKSGGLVIGTVIAEQFIREFPCIVKLHLPYDHKKCELWMIKLQNEINQYTIT